MNTTMFPTTPTKKVLTDNMKEAINASNTHRDAFVPEDLSVALMNVASRVRKSVTEGYNTQRVSAFSVPATPYSSPVKPTAKQSTPTPVFQTANDALSSVFPFGSPRVAVTPSPKKRSRAEIDFEERQNPNVDVEMDGNEPESDEVLVIVGSEANQHGIRPPRKIKPLRRGPQRAPADPFVLPVQSMSEQVMSSLADQIYDGMEMDLSGEVHA